MPIRLAWNGCPSKAWVAFGSTRSFFRAVWATVARFIWGTSINVEDAVTHIQKSLETSDQLSNCEHPFRIIETTEFLPESE